MSFFFSVDDRRRRRGSRRVIDAPTVKHPAIRQLLASTAFAAVIASAVLAAAAQSQTRTVYVSVTDKSGAPVTDLEAADFEVKEGGKLQAITVRRATAPLRIAILVADWGTGNFQAGMARFIEKLLGRAEFALISVLPQAIRILDYTGDPRALIEGLHRLGARGREQGAQLMEAIEQATKDVRAEGKRPVILVLRIGNEATTNITGARLRDQLRSSGAVLYVISAGVRGPAGNAVPAASDPITVAQTQLRNEEAKEGAFALNQVIGDGSRESGGRNEQIISTTMITSLEQVADELLYQYEITYLLPAGAKASDKISVSTKRKGVTLRAPSRLPS